MLLTGLCRVLFLLTRDLSFGWTFGNLLPLDLFGLR